MSRDKNNPNDNLDVDDDIEQPEVEKGLSKVATMPGKNVAVLVVFALVMGIVVYNLFFSGSSSNQPVKDAPRVTDVKPVKPAETFENPLPSVPVIAEAPSVSSPQLPVVQPKIVEQPKLIVPNPTPSLSRPDPIASSNISIPEPPRSEIKRDNNKLEQRRKSAINVGGSGSANPSEKEAKRIAEQVILSNFTPVKTSAEQVMATRIGDMTSTVAQGKIIDAILETAINTDLQGYIRAIVSRDVYAETGNAILIPKGSRLVGVYSAEIKRGQKRILIAWNRVIRPDGIDVMVDSPGIDQIGRAGTDGDVDNKYFEILTNAVLLSAVTYAISYQGEMYQAKTNQKVNQAYVNQGSSNPYGGTSTTTTTNGNVSTTTSSTQLSPSQKSFQDSIQNINDAAKKMVEGSLDERPTITVDQGTRIKVFVKKDLLFPSSYSSVKVIQ